MVYIMEKGGDISRVISPERFKRPHDFTNSGGCPENGQWKCMAYLWGKDPWGKCYARLPEYTGMKGGALPGCLDRA